MLNGCLENLYLNKKKNLMKKNKGVNMSVKYVAMKLIAFVDKGSYSNIVLNDAFKNFIWQLKKSLYYRNILWCFKK